MRINVFASGSTGNCALASLGGARILIDDGISLRRLKGFLASEGLTPAELDAVFITHEHRDHISGLASCPSTTACAYWLTVPWPRGWTGCCRRQGIT